MALTLAAGLALPGLRIVLAFGYASGRRHPAWDTGDDIHGRQQGRAGAVPRPVNTVLAVLLVLAAFAVLVVILADRPEKNEGIGSGDPFDIRSDDGEEDGERPERPDRVQ